MKINYLSYEQRYFRNIAAGMFCGLFFNVRDQKSGGKSETKNSFFVTHSLFRIGPSLRGDKLFL
jgi:hypothetical protein